MHRRSLHLGVVATCLATQSFVMMQSENQIEELSSIKRTGVSFRTEVRQSHGELYGVIAALGDDFDSPGFATVASPFAFEVMLHPGHGCPADSTDSDSVAGDDLALMIGR